MFNAIDMVLDFLFALSAGIVIGCGLVVAFISIRHEINKRKLK